jgi:hypothetical protein
MGAVMKKIFLFLLVSSLFLTHSYSQNLSFEQTQSDTIIFPLDVGNKFFYTGDHDPENGYYGSVKTIIDTTANGTRVVSVINYYTDSTSDAIEYWLFDDNKFYASSYQPFSNPVFNGYLADDTCVVGGLSPQCYYIFYETIFSQIQFCQMYKDIWFHMGTYVGNFTYTANNIGIYLKLRIASSYGFSERDSISLIGFIHNGILIGDSILTDIADPKPIDYAFDLAQNFPNPFNPSTVISYQLQVTSNVTLKVYDILGREVATLVNEEKPAGNYDVQFTSNGLTSGIYFYKLKTGNYSETKKMILIR